MEPTRRPAPAALLKYGGLLVLQVALSLVTIVYFKRTFGYRLFVIPLHGLLVTVYWGGVALALGLLVMWTRFRTWRGARVVVGLVSGLACNLLIALYASDFVANRIWGANVSFKVIGSYVSNLPSLLAALPFSPVWIYVPAIAVFAGVLGLYLGLANIILRGLEEASRLVFGHWLRAVGAAALLVAGAGAFTAFLWTTLHWRGQFWQGEPLVALFRGNPNPLFAEDARSVAIAQEAQRIRAAYPRDLSFDRKNVIIFLNDSLRSAHMQVYGYERPTTPFLQSLLDAGRLKKVALAASMCSETTCGLMATLTSRNYIDLAYYNLKIYDLLQDLGYQAYFIGTGDNTNFGPFRDALGRNLDLFFDGRLATRFSMNDDRMMFEALEQVPDSTGAPAFFFFFLLSTHEIGVKLDAYDVYQPSRIDTQAPWALEHDPAHRQAVVNRYDNGVTQADDMMRQLFAELDRKGYLRNSIAMILADHGEGLGEHGNYLHCTYLYQEDMGIPLLIYDAPNAPYANLEFATQIDVAPTLFARLGLPIPSCWEGRSLLEPGVKPYSIHTTLSIWPRRAIIHHTDGAVYKYIRTHLDDPQPVKEELYELTTDPGEKINLIETAPPALVQDVRDHLDREFHLPPTRQ
jgi:glucan phosphoethanolaminetransferase (alkaline phosphatase superfamily)